MEQVKMDAVLIPILSVIAAVAIVAVVIEHDKVCRLRADRLYLVGQNDWLYRKTWLLESELGRSDEPQREPRT